MDELKNIPLGHIIILGNNPRQYFNEDNLRQLGENIKIHGQVQNVIVRPKGDDYELIVGERRVRACALVGIPTIKAEVRDLNDVAAYELKLIENVHREDLSDAEKGDAIYQLWAFDKYETIKDVCDVLQIPYDTVKANWLPKARRLSPKVKELSGGGILANTFTDTHTRFLLKYPHAVQDKLANISVKRTLTSRQLQELTKLYDQDSKTDLNQLADKILNIKKVEVPANLLTEDQKKAIAEAKAKKPKKTRTKPSKPKNKDEIKKEKKSTKPFKFKKVTIKRKENEQQEKLITTFSFESDVEWCDYGINIYDGCYHDCSYCYGKLMNQRFKRVEVWSEPKKRNIDLNALTEALDKLDAGTFFFCSICDAYQPLNKELKWAREVLQVMLKSKHHIIILTKSADVEDDFDLISQYDNVEVAFTITSLDDVAYKKYEPNSSLPSEKVRVLRKAMEMGIKTAVSIEPWIIGHTQPLEIVKQLKDCVDRWIIGVANYMEFELEDYRKYVPALITYLIENNINYRFKAELDRVIKSYPILSRQEYENSIMQQVGDQ